MMSQLMSVVQAAPAPAAFTGYAPGTGITIAIPARICRATGGHVDEDPRAWDDGDGVPAAAADSLCW